MTSEHPSEHHDFNPQAHRSVSWDDLILTVPDAQHLGAAHSFGQQSLSLDGTF